MRKLLMSVAAGLLVMVMVACSSPTPVYNVEQASLNAPATASLSDIEQGIIRAGASRGWQMAPKGPGHLLATLSTRGHFAVVDIYFNQATYSIVYRESRNLDYDGTNIHGNYNKWIKMLQTEIAQQMMLL
jgi:hypothetical protein